MWSRFSGVGGRVVGLGRRGFRVKLNANMFHRPTAAAGGGGLMLMLLFNLDNTAWGNV